MDARSARAGAAAALAAKKEEIVRQWEARLRRAVPAAERASTAVLVDTVPAFLDRLVEVLSPEHPREIATHGTTIPREHGGERVRVTSFRLRDIVREYQLLRDVLFEALEAGATLDEDVRRTLTASLDAAVSEACTEYVLASDAIRERIMLTLAHDLRTPLSAAKNALALILRRPADAAVPRWAARADVNVDRIDRMVRSLLDVSRAGAGSGLKLEIEHRDLAELVHDVVDAAPAGPGRFVVDARQPTPGWWGTDALGRAIENVLANAVKYGAPDRPITVRVSSHHDRATVSVHNEGSYIPPELRERLFDSFRRAPGAERSREHGWGLGLALVRAVAEAHGGAVTVDSLPETGTTFTLDLPLDARPFQSA